MSMRRIAQIVLAGAAASAVVLGVVPAAQAATTRPGFIASFVSPYFFDGRASTQQQLATQLDAQEQVGAGDVIVEWAVHADARNAAYPSSPALGLGRFNDAVPALVQAVQARGDQLWMGLVVAPDAWADPSRFTSEQFLAEQLALTNAVADDLWAQYGGAVKGWYIPVEPSWDMISTPERAARLGEWYDAIADHLHALSGKPVMVSPSMPYAWNVGMAPTDYVAAMAPMIAGSDVDVWNLQDGFEMTGWSPETEANAFRAARALTDAAGAELWAAIYTPAYNGAGVRVPVSKLTPYLEALGALGVPLTQWEFAQYLSPDLGRPNGAEMTENLAQYRAYLGAAAPRPVQVSDPLPVSPAETAVPASAPSAPAAEPAVAGSTVTTGPSVTPAPQAAAPAPA
ncbi:MAG: DUF4434 domain-containing protein, partial [Microbacteriaceae bacterium]|nr:DUF4434 domain-containing protein [Microbacteriaceae bacterium]